MGLAGRHTTPGGWGAAAPSWADSKACFSSHYLAMLRSFSFQRVALSLGLLSALMLAACGGGDSSGPQEPPPPSHQLGVATPVGDADGASVSQTIGAEGGRLVLASGKFTLDVPAGALTQETVITAQPLTNHAHGGTGPAWRLGPSNVQFGKPVTLTFQYGDDDVAGAAPDALGIAFQRAGGVWEWVKRPLLDTAKRQVRVEATHFSDWALVRGLQLLPLHAVVPTGKTQGVRVLYCYPNFFDGSEILAPLGTSCNGELPAGAGEIGPVKEWAVNGVTGGNAVAGTIAGGPGGAVFTAPASRPSPATVAVSARIDRQGGGQMLLLSNITIADEGDYTGAIEFAGPAYRGTAQVAWKIVDDTPGVRTYGPSGTMELDISLSDCEPARHTVAIDNAYASGGMNAFMQVLFPIGQQGSRSHVFALSGKGSVTLQCGTPRQAREIHGSTFVVQVGACDSGVHTHPYSDAALLEGQFSCPQAGMDNVRWRFQAQ